MPTNPPTLPIVPEVIEGDYRGQNVKKDSRVIGPATPHGGPGAIHEIEEVSSDAANPCHAPPVIKRVYGQ